MGMNMSSIRSIDNKRGKRGFYTLEAVLTLPLVILAVLSIGYFIQVDSVWENMMYCALDESAYSASRAYGSLTEMDSLPKVKKRILSENEALVSLRITWPRDRYSDGVSDELTSYTVKGGMNLSLPAGVSRSVDFSGRRKYRPFKGKQYDAHGMGDAGLEDDTPEDPVWIFPQSGERYHTENCTYVRATVRSYVLTNSLKREYNPCEMCDSGELPLGSLVFCFRGEDTAYHRGTCRSIKRHTAVIDRSEAEEKGYTPCIKCGGT